MRTELLRFNGAVVRDPAIDAWIKQHVGGLGTIARRWFEVMRKCGDEVREIFAQWLSGCMFGRCPLRLRQCTHHACKCGVLQQHNASDSRISPRRRKRRTAKRNRASKPALHDGIFSVRNSSPQSLEVAITFKTWQSRACKSLKKTCYLSSEKAGFGRAKIHSKDSMSRRTP